MDAFPKEEEGNERDQEAQHRCSCSEQGARSLAVKGGASASLTLFFKLEVRLLSSFRGAALHSLPPPSPVPKSSPRPSPPSRIHASRTSHSTARIDF